MNVREMSGLELMQAMVDGTLPHPTMADTIPMRAAEVGRGYAKFRVRADSRHLNPLGGAEGSLRDAEGALYAHATCTCAIRRVS
jgi:acyl-coenzyme A thioesterase PaaI-like protein